MRICEATHEMVPDLLRLGRDFYAASGSHERGLHYDEADLVASIEELDAAGFFRVAVARGRVVGLVGGLLVPWYLCRSQLLAQEVWWWVDPDARDTGAGLALLEALEEWAREAGAVSVQIATPPSLGEDRNPVAVERLMRGRGYTWMEDAWSRRVAA